MNHRFLISFILVFFLLLISFGSIPERNSIEKKPDFTDSRTTLSTVILTISSFPDDSDGDGFIDIQINGMNLDRPLTFSFFLQVYDPNMDISMPIKNGLVWLNISTKDLTRVNSTMQTTDNNGYCAFNYFRPFRDSANGSKFLESHDERNLVLDITLNYVGNLTISPLVIQYNGMGYNSQDYFAGVYIPQFNYDEYSSVVYYFTSFCIFLFFIILFRYVKNRDKFGNMKRYIQLLSIAYMISIPGNIEIFSLQWMYSTRGYISSLARLISGGLFESIIHYASILFCYLGFSIGLVILVILIKRLKKSDNKIKEIKTWPVDILFLLTLDMLCIFLPIYFIFCSPVYM